VIRYGSNVPFWDEWDSAVSVLTGAEPLTVSWLWSQNNEHRAPLPRLVILSLIKPTGDFRAAMVFHVLVLGALAAAMIRAANRLRGHTAYSDAFLPLVVLSLVQYENLIWANQVFFTLPTALVGVLLLIVVRTGGRLTSGAAVLAGVCLVSLPLSSGLGLAYAPALTLWFGYCGVRAWRSGEPSGKRTGLVMLAFCLAVALLVGLYFVGYSKPGHHSYELDVAASLRSSLALLSLGFGLGIGTSWWPASGLVVAGLLLASAGFLGRAWWKQPRERFRALGLLFFLGAFASLDLAMGWARPTPAGTLITRPARYVTFLVPALCGVYLAWVVCRPAVLGRLVQACLAALAIFVFMPNLVEALEYGRYHHHEMQALERDLAAGDPPYKLLNRYTPFLFHDLDDSLTECFRQMRDTGLGSFQYLKENPPFREVSLSVEPSRLNRVGWKEGTAVATGLESYIGFTLPGPRLVYGIRITYRHANGLGTSPYFRLFWEESEPKKAPARLPARLLAPVWSVHPYPQGRFYVNPFLRTGPAEHTVTAWVGKTIRGFRIHPDDQPCVFHIAKIVLLVPAGAP
jgi:hypothetical protein